jgi:hypothetical protein
MTEFPDLPFRIWLVLLVVVALLVGHWRRKQHDRIRFM